VLIAVLQRSPTAVVVAQSGGAVAASTAGAVLRCAALAAASLGAVDSMAGATLLATTLTPNPTGPLPPFVVTVGAPITPLGFTIANLITIGSWKVSGTVPPGMTLTTVQPNGGSLTGPGGGNLDATNATNTLTTPLLEGTPTTPGTYTLNLQGFWYGGESGGPYGGKGVSSVFSFTIIVSAVAPEFTAQPISVEVAGGTVALSAAASYATSYQWMLNGSTPVTGATGPILVIDAGESSAGSYTCVATNAVGSTISRPATVSVSPTEDLGRLVNISARSQVGTGGNILIAGFVIGGQGTSGTESLLIRGSGPALTALQVAGALPDPQIQLFSGSALLNQDDGWMGSSLISSTAATVGAFAWTDPSSLDSALVVAKPSGAYTAQVSGASGDTGVALVEVYDATPAASYNPTIPRLINISTRVKVGTGGNILIAGFVIGGSTARTVLVRASGPALNGFGVVGTLPDPLLQLFSGSTVLASDQGWEGDANIAGAAASVGAFSWGDSATADSALLVSLPPGAYTAQVSGASGDTGVALVEVYEVP
jgi:hypothetical protein